MLTGGANGFRAFEGTMEGSQKAGSQASPRSCDRLRGGGPYMKASIAGPWLRGGGPPVTVLRGHLPPW